MVKQWFTFGFGQPHQNGYHIIESETKENCRTLMFERFGDKWAMQYDSAEAAGVERFNLKEIK